MRSVCGAAKQNKNSVEVDLLELSPNLTDVLLTTMVGLRLLLSLTAVLVSQLASAHPTSHERHANGSYVGKFADLCAQNFCDCESTSKLYWVMRDPANINMHRVRCMLDDPPNSRLLVLDGHKESNCLLKFLNYGGLITRI